MSQWKTDRFTAKIDDRGITLTDHYHPTYAFIHRDNEAFDTWHAFFSLCLGMKYSQEDGRRMALGERLWREMARKHASNGECWLRLGKIAEASCGKYDPRPGEFDFCLDLPSTGNPEPQEATKRDVEVAWEQLRKMVLPGQKFIWRGAFRWQSDSGVIENAYEGMSFQEVCDLKGWLPVHNCIEAGIVQAS